MSRKAFLAVMVLAVFFRQVTLAGADVTLQVTPSQGSNLEMDFGTARSLGPDGELESDDVVRQVRLDVSSDSGRTYRVFQQVNGPWTGPAGEEIPLSSIHFLIAEIRSGFNRFPGLAPLSLGEQEIFVSDQSGSPETLLITYQVKLPPGQRAGSYRTNVSYRVVGQ